MMDEVEGFMKTLGDKKYVECIINILKADKFKIDPSEYVYAKTAKEVGLGESRFELARIMEAKKQSRYGR
jgi:predicted RNA-binding protein